MEKSKDAFRTISEVAEWLDTPTHVLRFWESRFAQVKPIKRAGGRRYYRPADMALLGGIKKLLHDDGMTIRGVQKLLREEGVKHVAALSPPVDTFDTVDAPAEVAEAPAAAAPKPAEVTQTQPEPVAPTAAPPAPQDESLPEITESWPFESEPLADLVEVAPAPASPQLMFDLGPDTTAAVNQSEAASDDDSDDDASGTPPRDQSQPLWIPSVADLSGLGPDAALAGIYARLTDLQARMAQRDLTSAMDNVD